MIFRIESIISNSDIRFMRVHLVISGSELFQNVDADGTYNTRQDIYKHYIYSIQFMCHMNPYVFYTSNMIHPFMSACRS